METDTTQNQTTTALNIPAFGKHSGKTGELPLFEHRWSDWATKLYCLT